MKNEKITCNDVKNMDSEDFGRLKDAFYKISDGLCGLEDENSSLKGHEKEALKELKQAFEKLNHLGEIL